MSGWCGCGRKAVKRNCCERCESIHAAGKRYRVKSKSRKLEIRPMISDLFNNGAISKRWMSCVQWAPGVLPDGKQVSIAHHKSCDAAARVLSKIQKEGVDGNFPVDCWIGEVVEE